MPSRRSTPGGSCPPSCKYLCTASRPVNSTPEISTASPTFSARIFSSLKGVVSSGISLDSIQPLSLIQPALDFAARFERDALAAKGPAHVANADKIGGGQAV